MAQKISRGGGWDGAARWDGARTSASERLSTRPRQNPLSQGLKGVGGKLICLEEASRLDRQVFEEVVIPLLGVKDTAVIAISTPLDETNMYSQMIDLKQDDGKTPLFNVISITLICELCQGKDLKDQICCPHRQSEIPPWKTARRQDLVKKLLESNPEMYKREQLGVITSNANHAFPVHQIDAFERSSTQINQFVDKVFCAIDPAGGPHSRARIALASYSITKNAWQAGRLLWPS